MFVIKDVSKRKNHTRWGVVIPKEDTTIDKLGEFFGNPKTTELIDGAEKIVNRSEDNILSCLKADPNVEIHKVEKAKEVKKDKEAKKEDTK